MLFGIANYMHIILLFCSSAGRVSRQCRIYAYTAANVYCRPAGYVGLRPLRRMDSVVLTLSDLSEASLNAMYTDDVSLPP